MQVREASSSLASGLAKRQPIRTCLGCRQRRPQASMWRFALDGAGMLVMDQNGRLAGRHAYCCRDERCKHRFLKNKKGLSRLFRQQVLGFDEELKGLFGSGA